LRTPVPEYGARHRRALPQGGRLAVPIQRLARNCGECPQCGSFMASFGGIAYHSGFSKPYKDPI
jgi:hypothetical protein